MSRRLREQLPAFTCTSRTMKRATVLIAVLGLTIVASVASVAPASAAVPASPIGSLDSLTQTSGGVTVAGWALDAGTPATAIRVDIYSDGQGIGSVFASQARPDLASLGYGTAHGFRVALSLGVGTHTVCAYGIAASGGSNTTLGCRQITIAVDPMGSLDAVSQVAGGVTIAGWALDPDTPTAAIRVDIYADGVGLGSASAGLTRPDLASLGYGTAHGYSVTLPLAQGTHSVCAYGINVGPGSNVVLGCRQISVAFSPVGSLDIVVESSVGITVGGWAMDPDATSPITVAVYADNKGLGTTIAGSNRADLAPLGHGTALGFSTDFVLGQGVHTVCAYGINVGPGVNSLLGCKVITLNVNPFGSLDVVSQTSSGIAVGGWAIDPDSAAPIRVDVYDGSVGLGSTTANTSRPDVAPFGRGTSHGYAATFSLTQGSHNICAYGINVGAGANTLLGCQTINLDFSPVGSFDAATRTTDTTIAVSGWAYDPDSGASTPVRVSLDGVTTTVAANGWRPDVTAALAMVQSPSVGFSLSLSTTDGEHTICVTAVNAGMGNDTSLGCVIVNAVHPVAPGPAQGVSATGEYGAAVVTWSAPNSDGGAPVTYVIASSPGNISTTAGRTATSVIIGGLASGTTYTFTVTAVNVVGAGPNVASNATTTQTVPPPQTTVAPVSTSRYIRNIFGGSNLAADKSTLYAEGAADAAANASGHAYMQLLDIGGQTQSRGGVLLSAIARYVSYSDLVAALNAYVDGYASTQRPSAPATIALGTNNDGDVSAATGANWASLVVNPVAVHAASDTAIAIAGANDMEPGFSASVTATTSWLQGFLGATPALFVFNGSADGCNFTTVNGACNNGWTAGALFGLSAGAAPGRMMALPQIYNNTMAAQWKYISLTGVVASYPRVVFGGPLTEQTACAQAGSCSSLSPSAAWTALWNALSSDARLKPSSLPYSTDLRIN